MSECFDVNLRRDATDERSNRRHIEGSVGRWHPQLWGMLCPPFLEFGVEARHHVVGVCGVCHDLAEVNVALQILARGLLCTNGLDMDVK